MRMPGFTAEAVLDKKGACYRTSQATLQTSLTVVPAFWTCRGHLCCDEWGNCFYKGHVFM
jgi:hypothetical protein